MWLSECTWHVGSPLLNHWRPRSQKFAANLGTDLYDNWWQTETGRDGDPDGVAHASLSLSCGRRLGDAKKFPSASGTRLRGHPICGLQDEAVGRKDGSCSLPAFGFHVSATWQALFPLHGQNLFMGFSEFGHSQPCMCQAYLKVVDEHGKHLEKPNKASGKLVSEHVCLKPRGWPAACAAATAPWLLHNPLEE